MMLILSCTRSAPVLRYSAPVYQKLGLAELQEHLHSLPEHPDWIPYRTSYYKKDWGFCLTDRKRRALADDTYEVCVESTLEIWARSRAAGSAGSSGRASTAAAQEDSADCHHDR